MLPRARGFHSGIGPWLRPLTCASCSGFPATFAFIRSRFSGNHERAGAPLPGKTRSFAASLVAVVPGRWQKPWERACSFISYTKARCLREGRQRMRRHKRRALSNSTDFCQNCLLFSLPNSAKLSTRICLCVAICRAIFFRKYCSAYCVPDVVRNA